MFRRSPGIVVKAPVLQTPESFKGGNFKTGFQAEYTPFVIASIVTVAITAFDLVTDWLAFHHIKTLNLDDWFRDWTREENGKISWEMADVYKRLPALFLGFCILATIVFAVDLSHFIAMLYYKRKQFFEVRDGVPYERSIVERFSGECCVLLQTLFHNLPISLLFLALQAMVSCEFLIVTQHPVFYASVIASLISIVWKIAQVLWSAGCFGKRDEYTKSRIHTVLRIITFLLLIVALTITSLNLALLKPRSVLKHIPHRGWKTPHPLFDKVFIDSWLHGEKLVLYEHMTKSNRSQSRSSQTLRPASNNDEDVVNIIDMQHLIRDHNKLLVVTKPCAMESVNMSMYLPQDMSRSMLDENMQCSTVFNLYLNLYNHTLYVEYLYRVMSEDPRQCRTGAFMPSVPMGDNGGAESENDEESDEVTPTAATLRRSPRMEHELYFRSDMDDGRTMAVPCRVRISEWHPSHADPCSGFRSIQ